MARGSGKKDALIKCEYCGEMYSTTYKHCPFCNEDGTSEWAEPEEELEEVRPAGGKRLAAGSGGGYYEQPPQKSAPRPRSGGGRGRRNMNISPWSVLGVILSLALIIAAVCIVVSIFRSITGRGPKSTPTPPPPIESTTPTPTPTPPDEPDPTPSVEPTPEANKPTGFTLNASDLSFFNPGELYDLKVRLVPSDAEMPEVTWTSSDPNVASVSWNGRVTAISKGTVTITASIEGLGEQSCIFRCRFEGTAPSSSGSGNGNSSGLTLSREDFTLAFAGDSWTLVVSGTDSAVTWSSSNESIATVSSSGKVTAVSKGTCTVTATVDGVTLKCIVRCNW